MKKTIIYLSFFTILLYGCNKIKSPLYKDLTNKTESNGVIKYYYKDSLFTGTAYSYLDNKLIYEWFFNNGLYHGHIEYESDGEIEETVEMIIGNQRYVNNALDYNPKGVTRKQTSFNLFTHEILEIEYRTWDNCFSLDSFDYFAPSSHYRKINYFSNGMISRDYIDVKGKINHKIEYQLTKDGGRCIKYEDIYYEHPKSYFRNEDILYNRMYLTKDENCKYISKIYEIDDNITVAEWYDTTSSNMALKNIIYFDNEGNILSNFKY